MQREQIPVSRQMNRDESSCAGRREYKFSIKWPITFWSRQNWTLILQCPALSCFLDDVREREAGIKCSCLDAGQSFSTLHYCKWLHQVFPTEKLHGHSGTWKGSLADRMSCPDLIPVLLSMQKKQQGITTIVLQPGTKSKVSESNWWKIAEFPVGPSDEKVSDPSDLFVPAPSQTSWHSINTALQRHCFYLGVKKQRGGSQVLLL